MTIATCLRCSNTGAVGERYCGCLAGEARRDRAIDQLERNMAASAYWRAQGCPPGEILPTDNPEVN